MSFLNQQNRKRLSMKIFHGFGGNSRVWICMQSFQCDEMYPNRVSQFSIIQIKILQYFWTLKALNCLFIHFLSLLHFSPEKPNNWNTAREQNIYRRIQALNRIAKFQVLKKEKAVGIKTKTADTVQLFTSTDKTHLLLSRRRLSRAEEVLECLPSKLQKETFAKIYKSYVLPPR